MLEAKTVKSLEHNAMMISDLCYLEVDADNSLVLGAGDSFAFVKPIAIANALSYGGRNNIGSPAIGLALNISPVIQIPIF